MTLLTKVELKLEVPKGLMELTDAKVRLYFRNFMNEIGQKAFDIFEYSVPFDTNENYHMQWNIHKGDINRHPWGYSIDVGILPIEGTTKSPGNFGKLHNVDPRYPKFVDEGTGIWALKEGVSGTLHNPLGHFSRGQITPTNGNILVFTDNTEKGGGQDVYTRSTKGQKGQHFSERVHKEVDAYIETTIRPKIKLMTETLLK